MFWIAHNMGIKKWLRCTPVSVLVRAVERLQKVAQTAFSSPASERNGLAKRAPLGARFANPFRSLAGGEKAVCATFWSRSTARTRRDTEVHLSHFLIPMLWASQNTNYLRNRRHSIFFDVWGDDKLLTTNYKKIKVPPPDPPL